MFQDHSKTAVEIRDDCELEPAVEIGEDFAHLWIRIPDAGLGEMALERFEIRITVQLAEVRRDSIKDTINQLAPPALVVIRPRAIDGSTGWR
jgi:hypothetical protein